MFMIKILLYIWGKRIVKMIDPGNVQVNTPNIPRGGCFSRKHPPRGMVPTENIPLADRIDDQPGFGASATKARANRCKQGRPSRLFTGRWPECTADGLSERCMLAEWIVAEWIKARIPWLTSFNSVAIVIE